MKRIQQREWELGSQRWVENQWYAECQEMSFKERVMNYVK